MGATVASERWSILGPGLWSLLDDAIGAFLLLDADGRIVDWNRAAEATFGWTREEAVGAAAVDLLVAPDLPGEFHAAFDRLATGDRERWSRQPIDLRAMHRSGREMPIELVLSRVDAGGRWLMAAFLHDVTERNRTMAGLALANSRFGGAFQAASIGMALTGLDGRFLEVNPALCKLLARDADTLLASSFQEVTHPEDLAGSLEDLKRARRGEIDTFQQSKRYLLPDGGIVWGLLTLSIVRDAGGAPLHFVAQIHDITARKTSEGELRRYAAQLESLSEHDPLTGLSNQRAFDAALAAELRQADAGSDACSILLFRVPGGDSAVIAAAEALRRVSRDTDLVAHLGQDGELAVLLRGIDTHTVVAIAQRARDALQTCPDVRCSHATAARGESVGRVMKVLRQGLSGPEPASAKGAADQLPAGVGRLLELARHQLAMPVAFLTRLQGDNYVFARFAGDPGRFGVAEGDTMPLADTHCQRMLDGVCGSTIADAGADAGTRDLAATTALGVRAYAGVPIRLRSGEIYGTLCAVDTVPHPDLGERDTELMTFLSELTAELIEDGAEQRAARRAEAGVAGVRTLLAALEARDFYTGEHSQRVVSLASAVARRLGLDRDAVRDVEQVALLHDIGKVGIPDSILQKQGPLTIQEWKLMREHPAIGARILAGTRTLAHLAPAVHAEHERFDGTGYPNGLRGSAIPIASRITLACDAYDAMTTDRPYRVRLPVAQAAEELFIGAGTEFDPDVVAALVAELGMDLTATEAEPARASSPAPVG